MALNWSRLSEKTRCQDATGKCSNSSGEIEMTLVYLITSLIRDSREIRALL